MSRFYFTYGTDGSQPFRGGYTVIDADSEGQACAVFRAMHPDKHEGVLNCDGVYAAEQFKKHFINRTNFGTGCREYIAPLMSAEEILSSMLKSLKQALEEPFHSDAEKQMMTERLTGALLLSYQMGALSESFHEDVQNELQALKNKQIRRRGRHDLG